MNLGPDYTISNLTDWQDTATPKAVAAWDLLRPALLNQLHELKSIPILLSENNAALKHSANGTLYILLSAPYQCRLLERVQPQVDVIFESLVPKGKVKFVHALNAAEHGLKRKGG